MEEKDGGSVREIILHFDVPGHAITTDQFIDNIIGVRKIIKNLNEVVFDSKAQIKIEITPPKRGSFLINLDINVATATITAFSFASWAFIESKTGSAFIEGLTGRQPEQIAKELGRQVTNIAKDSTQTICEGVATALIKICTLEILIKNNNELIELGINEIEFQEALKGKSQFYNACIDNDQLKAVGFDESNKFMVTRDEFCSHIRNEEALVVDYTPLDSLKSIEEITNLEIKFETKEIKIFQMTWSVKNKQPGLWSAVFGSKDEIVKFKIIDDEFWKLVKSGQIKPIEAGPVNAVVQWCYEVSENRKTNYKVCKVIEFSGQILSAPLSLEELKLCCGSGSEVTDLQNEQRSFQLR